VTRWCEFEQAAPELASAGKALWTRHVLMYLGTTRRDGSPRVHPVVPILSDGDVFVAIGDWSPKWRDLVAEPRCVLHALPGPNDDEFVMRGRADPVSDPSAFAAVRAAAAHAIHDDDHLFRFRLDHVDHGWWEHVGQPGTFPVRRRWTPASGVADLAAGRRTDETS
jgi:hypothetical protein